jgi:hypothetical protein
VLVKDWSPAIGGNDENGQHLKNPTSDRLNFQR